MVRSPGNRSAAWLLVTALALGLLASWIGHGCLPRDSASAADRIAAQLSLSPHPDLDCPACAFQLQSRAAACDSPFRPPVSPDLGAPDGRTLEGPQTGAVPVRPPSRAPPLLG